MRNHYKRPDYVDVPFRRYTNIPKMFAHDPRKRRVHTFDEPKLTKRQKRRQRRKVSQ